MPLSVRRLSPECLPLAKGSLGLPFSRSGWICKWYVHVVLYLAYRGQHRHSGHLLVFSLFSLSHSLSEIHCFYSPSNLGVSLASFVVILIYIISAFHTICNLFY